MGSVDESRTIFTIFVPILVSDVDECATNTHDCAADADCINTDGSFICSCQVGYIGDGKLCQGTKMT